MPKIRAAVGVAALAVALLLGPVLEQPVHPALYVLIASWLVASAIFFGPLTPREGTADAARFRFLFFLFEVTVAALVARFSALGSLATVPLLLLVALDWIVRVPGPAGLAGAGLAAVAGGAVVVLDMLAGQTAGGEAAPDAGLAVAVTRAGLAAALIFGPTLFVARTVGRQRKRIEQVEALNAQLRADSQDLRDTYRQAEKAYEELNRTQAKRVNVAQMAGMETLVAGVAHELNTPLGAIHSNHDVINRALVKLQNILEDEVVTADELDEVRRIVVAVDGVLQTNGMAVDRMVGLVHSLRTFGNPDRAEIDHVDLHEGIEGTLALLQHKLEDRITVRREYGTLPLVECYPNKLNQVFMNLLLNGSQAIQGEGTITIRTSAENGRVAIEVGDTGIGIPTENLERIFQPGFTSKGNRMGMGLGLLISQQIVNQHGGEISVESVVGEGTTFTIRLPTRLPAEFVAVGEPAETS